PSLIYGREHRSDVEGQVWWYKIGYNLYEGSSLLESGSLVISHTGAVETQEQLDRYLLNGGTARLVITSIQASDDDFQTTLTNLDQINALVPSDVRLELQMEVERYDYLAPTTTATLASPTYEASAHDLFLAWSFVAGAEHYELEWAYVDGEAPAPTDPVEAFENAVNIDVPGNQHHVSLTYPRGMAFVRVRPVGRFIREVNGDYSHYKYGTWSSIQQVIITDEFNDSNRGFEHDRNWQYTTTFAEQGKHKKVISYFDDGLRNRQTQTNLSTEGVTLVSTAHYDVEGRPTVNILPVPDVNTDRLFFKPNFNRPEPVPGDNYNRKHFDRSFEDPCLVSPPDALHNSSGAGYYFSSAYGTSGSDDLYASWIPDAEGYPMTQVRYLNDGTGRIAWQSGVGKEYQLGSGRETRYFYDDPSSTQLHRLFGSNVGAAKYYKRNIVMDANQQMSVSYLDAAGRVIATALTGASPSNVDPLDSNPEEAVTITEDLLENNVRQGLLSQTQTTIFNEVPNNLMDLSYTLKGVNQWLNFNGCNQVCASCDYELYIRIEDPCGEVVEDEGVVVIEGPDICTDPTYDYPEIDLTHLMKKVGLYRITKELRVRERSMEDWLALLADCLPSLEDIPSIEIDESDCLLTCEQICASELGEGASDEAILACVRTKAECNGWVEDEDGNLEMSGSEVLCSSLLNQIHRQIAPGGCYYEDIDDNGDAWWDGLLENDVEFVLSNGAVVTLNTTAYSLEDSLRTPEAWQEDWLEILSVYHPEYCYYFSCIHSEESRQFDLNLTNGPTYIDPPEASGGTLDWDYVSDLIDADPMFDANEGFYGKYTTLPFPDHLLSGGILGDIDDAVDKASGIGLNDLTGLKVEFYQMLEEYGRCEASGPLVDVLDYLDCHADELPVDFDPVTRWRMFRLAYMGAKQRLRDRVLAGTVVGGDGWCTRLKSGDDLFEVCPSIIPPSDIYEIEGPHEGDGDPSDDFDDYIDNVDEDFCETICSTRVEEWIRQIRNACPLIEDDAAPLTSLRSLLRNHCEGHCDVDNPMAYLLSEDVVTAGLVGAVESIFLTTCPDIGDILTNTVAVPFDEVYSTALDPNGDPLCSVGTSGCLVDLITFLNGYFPVQGSCGSVPLWPNSATVCTAPLRVDFTTGNQRIYNTLKSFGSCCAYFEILIPGDSLCYIESFSAFRNENGLLLTDATLTDGNVLTLEFVCVSDPAPDFPYCFMDCIVVPDDVLVIDLEEITAQCLAELAAEAELIRQQNWEEAVNEVIESALSQRTCLDNVE
ncbi:MAG: hypothetical protein AAGD05_05200, partial [Bacteroidota bacterium]